MATLNNIDQRPLLDFPWGALPLRPARFVARPNRFVGVFCWDDTHDEPLTAHIADPGRLKELLLPNARVWVVDHGPDTHRKMRYTLPLVQSQEGPVVSIFSRLPNHVFITGLKQGQLPYFSDYLLIKSEPSWQDPATLEKSRFDALLTSPHHPNPVWVEVKGASLVESGVCLFPDAVTVRGARQIRQLGEMAEQNHETHVVFMVQRPDAKVFKPHWQRDPAFSKALITAANAGVHIHAQPFTIDVTQGIRLEKPIPVDLSM